MVRFGYNPTDALFGYGGVDIREVDAAGPDKENPTYNVSLQYKPFDYTTVALSAGRSIGSSYFSDFNTETESVTLTLQQRLFDNYDLTVSYGERSSDYLSLLSNFAVARDDTYDSFSINLSTYLLNRFGIRFDRWRNRSQGRWCCSRSCGRRSLL